MVGGGVCKEGKRKKGSGEDVSITAKKRKLRGKLE